MSIQKRIAAIHDLSGFGKCSLTVILPILSAAGHAACPIPTAVLSTHTGGLPGFTFKDLTDEILPIASHWNSLGLAFDAVYTGYVGSLRQFEILEEVLDLFHRKETLIVVDPVMGDHGLLYKKFTQDFPEKMRKLVEKADMVLPNITEAALLLGKDYREGPHDRAWINSMLIGVSDLGPRRVVLTGVCPDERLVGAAVYDRTADAIHYAFHPRIEGNFHGTGDVFASALLGALLRGKSLDEATGIAVNFTAASIAQTVRDQTDVRYGVNFEAELPVFIRRLSAGLSTV